MAGRVGIGVVQSLVLFDAFTRDAFFFRPLERDVSFVLNDSERHSPFREGFPINGVSHGSSDYAGLLFDGRSARDRNRRTIRRTMEARGRDLPGPVLERAVRRYDACLRSCD